MASSCGHSSSSAPTSRSVANWSWWDEVVCGTLSKGGGSRAWRCKLCNYERTGAADKVKAHFLHEKGKEVKFCPNVTSEKRQELLDRNAAKQGFQVSSGRRTSHVAVDPGVYAQEGTRARQSPLFPMSSSSMSSMPASAMPTSAFPHASSSSAPRARQSSLDASWNVKKKDDVDAAVARFFYHDHIAFHAAKSPYFKNMVTKRAEYGPTYKPPSSETLRTTLLAKEKAAIELATANIRMQWERNGVTLIADGWSDTRSRSIHGVVAYSRGEVYFIGSHDASGTGKSADVLAAEWALAVETVGAQNVIQFVADGENANRAAGEILQDMYPHITFSPCMAHCLNNLLKDIGKLKFVSPLIEKANKIVTFVRNHQFLLAEFRKNSDKELLKYSDTRFMHNFLMLRRLQYCGGALRQLFVSDVFMESAMATSETGIECADTVSSKSFWDNVRRINEMVEPITKLLRLADGLEPCIGKIYENMDKMIEKLAVLEKDASNYVAIKAACTRRWNAYHSPLHAAAFAVDPEFQGRFQENDEEVSSGWTIALHRLVPSIEGQRQIKNQLSAYRQFKGRFNHEDAQTERTKINGALWWEDYGSSTPELQRLAVRILSQAISSSCLEQLWSSFSHIASKKRNILGVQKTNDLVYVSSNLRLLAYNADGKADTFVQLSDEDGSEHQEGDPVGSTIGEETSMFEP